MNDQPTAYELDEGETVGCYYCMKDHDYRDYGRGEAFLCGPDHEPWDGNANYICKSHLSPDAVIFDPYRPPHEQGRE